MKLKKRDDSLTQAQPTVVGRNLSVSEHFKPGRAQVVACQAQQQTVLKYTS